MARGLSDENLVEIERRVDRTTPGPWFVRILSDEWVGTITAITTKPGRLDDPPPHFDAKEVVAVAYLAEPNYVNVADERGDENATFIAHARIDVPLLIAEVRRLRAALLAEP